MACGDVLSPLARCAVARTDEVGLVGTRHPLLDPAEAVPIDLDLARNARARHQRAQHRREDGGAEDTRPCVRCCINPGLRPQAVTAELPVFDRVLADIGNDESHRDEPLDVSPVICGTSVEIVRGRDGAVARPGSTSSQREPILWRDPR